MFSTLADLDKRPQLTKIAGKLAGKICSQSATAFYIVFLIPIFFFFLKEYDPVLPFYYENVKYKNTCYLWSLFLDPYETVFLDLIMD